MRVTASQMRENPELLKDYQEWCRDPRTETYIDMLRLEAQSPLFVPLERVRAEAALALLGQQAGACWAMQRLVSMDKARENPDQLAPSFGAQEILESQKLT